MRLAKLQDKKLRADGGKLRRAAAPIDDFGTETTPVAQYILDSPKGRLMSKTTAQRLGVYKGNEALWNGAPSRWSHGHHNSIYSEGGGMMPDQMAQHLANDHRIPDAYPDTMWEHLINESKSASERAKATKKQAFEFDKAQAKWEAEHPEEVAQFEAEQAARESAEKGVCRGKIRELKESLARVTPEVDWNPGHASPKWQNFRT